MDTFIWHALPMPFTSLHQNSDPNYLPKVDAIGWFDKTVVSLGSLGLVSALHQGEHLGEFRWRPQPWWLTLQFLGWAYSAAGLNPASRRMSSRRTLRWGLTVHFTQCLEFKWVPHDTPDIFCGIGIQPPAGECPHLPRRRQVAWL